jgi:transposase
LSPGVLGLESGCTTKPIEEESMIFVGDDWAEDHHDVHVMDEAGLRLSARRLPEGLTGIRQLHALIASHTEEPDQVVIGIETDRGLWVEALVAAGYQVFAINPLAVARLPRTPSRFRRQI